MRKVHIEKGPYNKKRDISWYSALYFGPSDEGVKRNNPVNCSVARESLRGENESPRDDV